MKSTLLTLIVTLLFSKALHAQQNAIVIIADDVSSDYFGFYPEHKDTATTPTLRTLAENGIVFTGAWSNPVCSPTRSSMFTGRYAFRTGVGNVITNNQSAQLDTAEMSIAKLLRNYAPVKYNTGCVGKWHMHASIPIHYNYPRKMGFQMYSGNMSGALPDFYNYPIVQNGVIDSVNIYATTQTVNDAIDWLDTINPNKPFFLWCAFNASHTPYHKPPDSLITVTGLTGTQMDINQNPEKYFKAALEAMDTEIGRLLQYLTANNLMDSTNIIFVGDNGNEKPVAQLADTSHAKGTIYDYGVHVPYIIKGPAVVNPNRTSDALVSTTDLFSTVAELCGFTNWMNFIPANKLPIDARSLLPIIKNQNTSVRDWNFTELFDMPVNAKYGKSIRNNDYHLLRFDNGNEELYNLANDSSELFDLLTGTLTSTELSNYNSLCDTLSALTGTISCNTTQGVSEIKSDLNYLNVQNPFEQDIIVTANNNLYNADFALLDLTGRTIYQWNSISLIKNEPVHFSIAENLSKGIYFLSAKWSDKNYVTKIIHQ